MLLVLISNCALAQVDSIGQHVYSIKTALTKPLIAIDSTSSSVNQKLDSIEQRFSNQVDRLKQSYAQAKGRIGAMQGKYQQKVDSLSNLKLPIDKYSHKVDSLVNELTNVQKKATAKIDSLKKQVTNKIKSLNLPPEADKEISKLTANLDKVTMPSIDAEITNKFNLGNMNSMPGLEIEGVGGVAILKNVPSTGLPNVPDGSSIQGNLNQLNGVTEKAGNVQQQLKEVTSPDKLSGTIENKVSEIGNVKAIQGKALPGETALPSEIPATGEEAKEQLATLAKKEAVNHFAGKEVVLQQAMDKMSKYKKKYSDVESIKGLPKKAPNPLKGKPFIERLVPGITLQFQSNADFMLDVNLSAGYKFTPRITAGLGWNHRWAYSTSSNDFNPEARIFGVRSYGEFHFKKGFALRADVECMNALVTSGLDPTSAISGREWVWSAFTGVKQEYRISKSLRGNFQILYNMFDRHNKSPYADRLNMRMGFEYMLKKKKTGN